MAAWERVAIFLSGSVLGKEVYIKDFFKTYPLRCKNVKKRFEVLVFSDKDIWSLIIMPLFYHYTDDEGAQRIIRTGRVLASLESDGDAAYGNGVYLTQLEPQTIPFHPDQTSKIDIARNNWMNVSPEALKKTENYFVFDIPESDVKDTKAKNRNIFLFGDMNDLLLHKYPWWLKNYDSNKIIASYKYSVMSFGPAFNHCPHVMGDYVITEETVNGRPVYQHDDDKGPKLYLSMSTKGCWFVGPVGAAGKKVALAAQVNDNHSLGPDSNSQWIYGFKNTLNGKDSTLNVYAWQR